MMTEPALWLPLHLFLFAVVAVAAHLVVSASQTLLHYGLGHRRLGGAFCRNHIRFHHTVYARGHLVSAVYSDGDGNLTPYFLIPTVLGAGVMYLILPLHFFLVVVAASAASFWLHVYFDHQYHVEDSWLCRFPWFRRKQRLHFVHHLHANTNFAVIDFFWDRLLGTFRQPDGDTG
jgi:sterol desaturase/sphingolipid hydroxylase (fatty acid hydroxylase superfamily)